MLIYTQMNPRGTAFMQALGLPFYVTAIVVGLAISSWFPGAYLATLFGAFFIYSLAYSKALHYFVHRLRPARPLWQFVLAVLVVQALIMAATLYGIAA
jgi:hypothetical protein